MTGFTYHVNGDKLTIEVDLSNDAGSSKSGKTRIIASSHGNIGLDGADESIKLGLNVYRGK